MAEPTQTLAAINMVVVSSLSALVCIQLFSKFDSYFPWLALGRKLTAARACSQLKGHQWSHADTQKAGATCRMETWKGYRGWFAASAWPTSFRCVVIQWCVCCSLSCFRNTARNFAVSKWSQQALWALGNLCQWKNGPAYVQALGIAKMMKWCVEI